MRQFKPGQLQTGSLYPITASYALTASYLSGSVSIDTGSLVTTASFNAFTASYTTGSFTGSFRGDGSQLTGIVSSKWTGSNPISRQSDVEITGSLRVQGSITGSLFGTASWATNAVTASYVQTAQTASYVLQAVSASFATSASRAVSSSFATTASFAATSSAALLDLATGDTRSYALTMVLSASAAFTSPRNPSPLAVRNELVFNGNTGVLQTTASVALTASIATTASHALEANTVLPLGGNKLSGFISYVISTGSMQYVRAHHTLNIDIPIGGATSTVNLTGSLVATSITSSLQGTASFANTSTSASYAVTASYLDNYVPPFPYTGSAIITGSLTVIDENQYETINTVTHTFKDTADIQSIEWDKRQLTDSAGTVVVEWNAAQLTDTTDGTLSVAWADRMLYDINGTERLAWSYSDSRPGAIDMFAYSRNYIDITGTAETLANFPVYGKYVPTGETLQGVTFDAAVVNFDLVYLETDNIWYPVDMATASSTRMLGIAYNISAGDYVLLEGTSVVNDSALTDSPQVSSIQTGTPIYINTSTAGIFMSTTVPSTTGNYVRLLGYAYYQSVGDSQYWLMKFRPSNDWYVI